MPQTVMMIDDDEDFLEELGELLGSSGYRAVAVHDPLLAVATAKNILPALILMDLRLPGTSGFELTSELNRQPELSGVPIIAMSGVSRPRVANMPGVNEFRECLSKPFNPLDVIWILEKYLSEKQSGSKEGRGLGVS